MMKWWKRLSESFIVQVTSDKAPDLTSLICCKFNLKFPQVFIWSTCSLVGWWHYLGACTTHRRRGLVGRRRSLGVDLSGLLYPAPGSSLWLSASQFVAVWIFTTSCSHCHRATSKHMHLLWNIFLLSRYKQLMHSVSVLWLCWWRQWLTQEKCSADARLSGWSSQEWLWLPESKNESCFKPFVSCTFSCLAQKSSSNECTLFFWATSCIFEYIGFFVFTTGKLRQNLPSISSSWPVAWVFDTSIICVSLLF